MSQPEHDPGASATVLFREWKEASRGVLEAEMRLSHARTTLMNAANALGRFLGPRDAKPGEVFSIWIGEELVQATLPASGRDYEIKIRNARRSP